MILDIWHCSSVNKGIREGKSKPIPEVQNLTVDDNPNAHDGGDKVEVLLDPYSWLFPQVHSFPSIIFLLDYWSLALVQRMFEHTIEHIHHRHQIFHFNFLFKNYRAK